MLLVNDCSCLFSILKRDLFYLETFLLNVLISIKIIYFFNFNDFFSKFQNLRQKNIFIIKCNQGGMCDLREKKNRNFCQNLYQ